jgi:bifunctional UDP-N-acetylglucosamine pyrophosphorylase/glucosamine-1-phosphate N-acetyltransferase
MKLGIAILAAGQGTRMRSEVPKVLHALAGRPLLAHVIEAARGLKPETIVVVYGHGGAEVPRALAGYPVQWVEQRDQLGTAHAVQQALPSLGGVDRVLVLYGDVPLISASTLERLLQCAPEAPLALLSMTPDDPAGYGRILRDSRGHIQGIVEEKDASSEQRSIREVNTGILLADREALTHWLSAVDNANAQGEFYLTDIVGLAVAGGQTVASAPCQDAFEVIGVNDRIQLAALERRLQAAQARQLMKDGVTLRDPNRFDLRGELRAGVDVEIDINVILEGDVQLGDRVQISANTLIRNAIIGPDTHILENCVIESAVIGANCRIGPFARVRPGTHLEDQGQLGNFVEIKNAVVGAGTKINHLSYVGDTEVGSSVNIGAGTITCNYDGARKHRTIIGDRAFIGSNTALVAPVRIGDDATVGAGSTITRNAPADTLTLSRAPQQSLPGWRRPSKRGEPE